jgi:hypothetical protein
MRKNVSEVSPNEILTRHCLLPCVEMNSRQLSMLTGPRVEIIFLLIPTHRGRHREASRWRSGDGGARGCASQAHLREAPGHVRPNYVGPPPVGLDADRTNAGESLRDKVGQRASVRSRKHGPEAQNRRGGAPEGDALSDGGRAGRKAETKVRLLALRPLGWGATPPGPLGWGRPGPRDRGEFKRRQSSRQGDPRGRRRAATMALALSQWPRGIFRRRHGESQQDQSEPG